MSQALVTRLALLGIALLSCLFYAQAFSAARAGSPKVQLVVGRSQFGRRMQLFAQLGRVTMYKKETCPYCKKARELLEGKYGLKVTYVDVEEAEASKREEILQQMRTFSGGRNTVPQIFFNAEHLGGNDDVQKLDVEGKLKEKVDMVLTQQVSMMQDNWYHPWY